MRNIKINSEKVEKLKASLGYKAAEIIANDLKLDAWDGKKAKSPFKEENTPSFIWHPEKNRFKCFSTGKTYDIIDHFISFNGLSFKGAVKKLFEITDEVYDDEDFAEKKNKDYFANYKYPHDEEHNDRAVVEAYMAKRGISKETLDFCDVKQSHSGDIAFQFLDVDNNHLATKYRIAKAATNKDKKWYWQSGASNCPLLYGINKIDLTKPLVITEGLCFPPEAELMTEKGWVRVDSYNGEKVIQVDDKLRASLVYPEAYVVNDFDGELYSFEKANYTSITTPDHKIVYKNRFGQIKKKEVSELSSSINGSIPVSARYKGGNGVKYNIRLLMALVAFGEVNEGIATLTFEYWSDCAKIRSILDNEVLTDYTYQRDSNHVLKFRNMYPDFTITDLYATIYEMTSSQLRETYSIMSNFFIGKTDYSGSKIACFFKDKDIADLFQTVCHLVGYIASIREGMNHIIVDVITTKNEITWRNMDNCKKMIPYKGKVYCVKVPTGMIMVRQNGNVTITSNCDRLAVVEAGYTNVVSINGGANDYNWISFNYDQLEKIPEFIIWSDDDKPGQEMAKECVSRLGMDKTRVVSPDNETKAMIREFYAKYGADIDKVDANNVLVACGGSHIIKLINSAKEVENPRLKRLMDYEEQDLQDLPRVSTGIRKLDSVVTGNFEGNLTIITAPAGAGKSTFAAIFSVIAPIEEDKNVMVFSGEMPASMLLGLMMRPIAGRDHIIEWDNSANNQPNGYSVTNEAKRRIKEFYRDKIWNYEDVDEMVTDSVSILETIEYAYKRYGVTDFLIDNLMTITFSGSEDKFDSQIKFVMALKRLTRKYGIRITLVAHPRKQQAGEKEITMSSIAGAAEIVNLANRAYALVQIHDDPEGYNVKIDVLKDRETGKVGSYVKLYFDFATLRIYSDTAELNRKYKWADGFNPKYPDNIKNMLVKGSWANSDSRDLSDVLG